jgi:hypothetical protein
MRVLAQHQANVQSWCEPVRLQVPGEDLKGRHD